MSIDVMFFPIIPAICRQEASLSRKAALAKYVEKSSPSQLVENASVGRKGQQVAIVTRTAIRISELSAWRNGMANWNRSKANTDVPGWFPEHSTILARATR